MNALRIFRGHVLEDGSELKLERDDAVRWRGYVTRLRGRRVELTLRPERKRRSLKANAYLWAVVYGEIAAWSGHDPEEIHEAMKAKFLRPREILFHATGETLEAGPSTALLSSDEFSEYVSKVKLWAAESGVRVPEPNEVEASL